MIEVDYATKVGLMTEHERAKRKEYIESRRVVLNQRTLEVDGELDDLCDEYGEILDAEAAEQVKEERGVPLHEVPRQTWVSLDDDPRNLFFFDHIDEAHWPYCLTIDGKLMHIGASTLVLVHDIELNSPEAPPVKPDEYRTEDIYDARILRRTPRDQG